MKTTECPSCNGQGDYMIALHPESGPSHRECHQCGGSGEVEVDDDFDEEEDHVEEYDYDQYAQDQKDDYNEYKWEYDNER